METDFLSNTSFQRVETDFLSNVLLFRSKFVLVEIVIQIKVRPFCIVYSILNGFTVTSLLLLETIFIWALLDIATGKNSFSASWKLSI